MRYCNFFKIKTFNKMTMNSILVALIYTLKKDLFCLKKNQYLKSIFIIIDDNNNIKIRFCSDLYNNNFERIFQNVQKDIFSMIQANSLKLGG